MHVCVLGGGVIGVTTAYYLARDGHDVTLVDKNPNAALAASYANGGQLSYSYVTPLAGPAVLRQLPGMLLSRDAALRYVPALDWQQWRWCLAFLAQCTASRSRQTTINMLALGAYSREQLHSVLRTEMLDFSYRRSGKLVLYRDAQAFSRARDAMSFYASLGACQEAFTPTQCIAAEPALASLESRLSGGIYTASEDSGDCHRFTCSLSEVAGRKHGVAFRYGVNVHALREERGRIMCASASEGGAAFDIEADAFVVALGNGSSTLLKPLGEDIPIYPLKGYSITAPIGRNHVAPSICVTDLHHKIVFARLGDSLRVAGMIDITGASTSGDAHRLALLASQARATFPNAADYDCSRTWTGARPATPDSKPLLGPTRHANLWLNTGHGALGFTLACASAALVADCVANRTPALDVSPFTVNTRRSYAVAPRPDSRAA